MKLHEVDAAEGRGVLVLPAAGEADIDAFDLVGQPRDVVLA